MLLSAHSPHGITSSIIIQNCQVVKKKLNLKKMVEVILVYNTRTKILADLPFSHNDSPEQYKKKHPREI